MSSTLVSSGQEVEQGDPLGIEGETGAATGEHIHFGVFRGDPETINKETQRLGNLARKLEMVGLDEDLGLGMKLRPENQPSFSTYSIETDGSGNLLSSEFDPLEGQLVYSDVDKPESLSKSGHIDLNETVRHSIFVQDNKTYSVELGWFGSELMLEVFNPDNQLYRSIRDTDGLIDLSLNNANPGLWQFQVTALDVPSRGEPYTLDVLSTKTIPEPRSICLVLLGLAIMGLVYLIKQYNPSRYQV